MARIIWITERHTPATGGMAVSSTRLVNSLRDRGHSVTVLHLTRSPVTDGNAPFLFRDVEGHWEAMNAQHDLERIFFLKRRAMEGSMLVGFGGSLPGYLATLWGQWLGSPSIVMFRGNDLDRSTHDLARAFIVNYAIERADLVCAVARDMVSRLEGMRSGPVLYTPVGIIPQDWSIFPSDIESAARLRRKYSPDGRPLIGIFGQLKYKKGLTTALDVFHNYGMSRHARLLSVGDIPEGPERSVIEASCTDFWSVEPFVRRELLVPYYLACDLVFIPSLYDGMPNVLLEAMICKRPVVGGGAGGIPDVITDGTDGFLFDAGDSIQATEVLSRVLSFSHDARAQIGERAFGTVAGKFTDRHEADILESALNDLMKEI